MTLDISPQPKTGHIEIGDPRNPKPYAICGANNRNEVSAELCLQKAGWGTYHPGSGKCKLHGGSTQSGPLAPVYKHGRYAHVWRGDLARHFAAIQQDGTDPLDLLPELEVQRTVLALYLDRLAGGAAQPADLDSIPSDLDDISDNNSIASTSSSTPVGEGGISSSSSLGTLVVHPRKQFLLSGQQLEELRLLTSDIVNTVTKIISARNQTALTKAEIIWMMSTLREGIEMFVPREKQAAFVKWLQGRLPIEEKKGGAEAEDEQSTDT